MWKIFTYADKLLSDSLVKQVTEQHLQEERLYYKMSKINFPSILKPSNLNILNFWSCSFTYWDILVILSPRQLKNNDSF